MPATVSLTSPMESVCPTMQFRSACGSLRATERVHDTVGGGMGKRDRAGGPPRPTSRVLAQNQQRRGWWVRENYSRCVRPVRRTSVKALTLVLLRITRMSSDTQPQPQRLSVDSLVLLVQKYTVSIGSTLLDT